MQEPFLALLRERLRKGEATVFEAVGLIGNALILPASLIILNRASDLTTNSSVKVSEITGFGKTTVGFVFVDFSTSLPELSIDFRCLQPSKHRRCFSGYRL